MPYRHAYWFLLSIFPLAALAFWQSYLSKLTTSSPELHAHGVTAALWLALLTLQSWSIHAGHTRLHRVLGRSSLFLFPLFLAGGIGIFIGMAHRFVDRVSPFYEVYAPRLALLDVVAVAGIAYFYFEALRRRRDVQFHARFMLASVFFLLPPILGRLAPALPPLTPTGAADFWKLGLGFQLANAVTAGLALWLAVSAGRYGRPFYVASLLTIVGALLFQFVGGSALWRGLFAQVADLPTIPLVLAAGMAGVFIAFGGWQAGRPAPVRQGAVVTG